MFVAVSYNCINDFMLSWTQHVSINSLNYKNDYTSNTLYHAIVCDSARFLNIPFVGHVQPLIKYYVNMSLNKYSTKYIRGF